MPAANQRPENELRAEAYLSRVSALQSELTCQLQHLRALRAHGRAASGAQDVLTPLRLRQVQRRVEQLRADLSRAAGGSLGCRPPAQSPRAHADGDALPVLPDLG